MKIQGYINYAYHPPAPFIVAAINIQKLNIKATIPFLIDTGASNTMILWGDLERLGININKIKPQRDFSGLGGLIKATPLNSTITFITESGEAIKENLKIYIVASKCPHPKLKLLPSIMGRDLINKYKLIYNHNNKELYLER